MVDGEKGFKFEVRPLSSMLPSERERALSNQQPQLHHNALNTVTTDLYDSMPCDDDPVPVQRIPAGRLHIFAESDAGPELQRVDNLVVFSDGTLFAEVDEEIVDPDEIEGFVGFLLVEKKLRSEEDAYAAFESTRI